MRSDTALYSHRGKSLRAQDFLHALSKAGIKKGDVIFVHSDISVFGKLAMRDKRGLLAALSETLMKSIGTEGTVIMPTFSYSFTKREAFDPKSTPSTVGVLTEYFRKEKGVVRTKHPIFSVAVWGKHKKKFSDVGTDSFGEDSIFGSLRRSRGKVVFFGAPVHSLTFLHYIEQAHGVPYRYFKTFKGTIVDGTRRYRTSARYFVRDLKKDVETDTSRLEARLRASAAVREAFVGGSRILAIPAADIFTEGMRMLDWDIHAFLKRKPQ